MEFAGEAGYKDDVLPQMGGSSRSPVVLAPDDFQMSFV